jgi:hypothetical protein
MKKIKLSQLKINTNIDVQDLRKTNGVTSPNHNESLNYPSVRASKLFNHLSNFSPVQKKYGNINSTKSNKITEFSKKYNNISGSSDNKSGHISQLKDDIKTSISIYDEILGNLSPKNMTVKRNVSKISFN